MLQSDELHQREGEVWEVVAAQVEVAQLRQTAQLGREGGGGGGGERLASCGDHYMYTMCVYTPGSDTVRGGGERGSLAVETTTCTQCVCTHQVVTLYASSFTRQSTCTWA